MHDDCMAMSYNAVVSAVVARQMRRRGATQRAVARQLGISTAALSRRLSGKHSWRADDLALLARAGYVVPPLPYPTEGTTHV